MTSLPEGVAGEFSSSIHESFTHDYTILRVEQRLASHRVAARIPVSRQMLDDSSFDLTPLLAARMDRVFRPWLYPDRPAMALEFDWFPRLRRMRQRLLSLKRRARRLRRKITRG